MARLQIRMETSRRDYHSHAEDIFAAPIRFRRGRRRASLLEEHGAPKTRISNTSGVAWHPVVEESSEEEEEEEEEEVEEESSEEEEEEEEDLDLPSFADPGLMVTNQKPPEQRYTP
jgi:hypothetical protein